MTDLLLADFHLSDNPRDQYRLDFVARLPKLVKQQQADCLYILGDLTERKNKHDAALVNKIVELMTILAGTVPVVLLKGNHDYQVSDEPFFEFLQHIDNIQYISQPTRMDDLLLLPHTARHKQDWAGMDFDGVQQIYTHNSFNGANAGRGVYIHGGIPLDALPSSIQIYSGDIHQPQKISNLIYVGAPFTVYFGDDYEPRAVLVNGSKHQSFRLNGPQKRLLRVDINDQCSGKANKGDIVRIDLQLRPADYANWEAIRHSWQQYCTANGFQLDSIRPQLVTDADGAVSLPQRLVSRRGDKEWIYDHCRRNQVDQPTQELGIELL